MFTSFWSWAVNDESLAASYAFAGTIIGGTFASIIALATIFTLIVH